MVFGHLNETWKKIQLKIEKFKDNLIKRNNSLNSVSFSDCPDRLPNGLSYFTMHELRKSKPFRVIVGHININSVRNKFELLKRNKDNIDILLLSKVRWNISGRPVIH